MTRLAHFNWTRRGEEYLLTNDMGRYIFLPVRDFEALMGGTLPEGSESYTELQELGFLYEDEESYISDWAESMSCMKQCLLTGTQLLILVLTDACNQRCAYCQAGGAHAALASIETCRKAIDIAVQSPVARMTVEFQGGEPTMNPEALRFTIPYAKRAFSEKGKRVDFAIVTNMTNPDPDLIRWLVSENVHVSTSLDGPRSLHETNRPLASGQSSYDAWHSGMEIYREVCAELGKPATVGAIQTTTRESLRYPREIVDEYMRCGMDRLYIRPLTPLGFAKERWESIGYTAQEFLDFYLTALNYMLDLCKQGHYVSETTASIYLARILQGRSVGHTEYRSPCGAGVGQIAVNYDGNIYTCDEGRMVANMGDPIFRIGAINDSYRDLMQSPAVHAVCTASCIEALPFCRDCAYMPYCSTCPVVNYGTEGDLVSHDEHNYRCEIARRIMDYLFTLIREDDPQTMGILREWVEEA